MLHNDQHNSDAADLGFMFGDAGFNLRVATYQTQDSPQQVFSYYRKGLARYGEVLECDHGHAVGGLQRLSTGLTCSDEESKDSKSGSHTGIQLNGSSGSNGHELRAGSPQRFRVVVVEARDGGTSFTLCEIELPKHSSH